METLSPTQVAAFKAVRDRLSAEERTRVDIASVEAVDPAVASAPHWNFDLPAHAADKALGEGATDAMRRALVHRRRVDPGLGIRGVSGEGGA